MRVVGPDGVGVGHELMASAHIVLNSAEIARLATSTPVTIIVRQTAEQIRTASVRRCPVDTGDLRASIAVEMMGNGRARVGSRLRYAIFVHEGHGDIYPVRKTILRWPNTNNRYRQTGGNRRYSGGATASYVFARHVRPVKGRPFLVQGAQDVLGPANVRAV